MNGRTSSVLIAMIVLLVSPVFAGGSPEDPSAGRDDSAAAEGAAEGAEGELRIFVSVQPQKYFVERIAGSEAEVTVMVPPGKEPATYDPTPRQVSQLSTAHVYFRIRVPFEESFLPRVERSLEDLRIVDTTENIDRRHLAVHDHEEDAEDEESHGDEQPGEGAVDPHVWLGPMEVKAMAATIRDTLSELRPENEARYEENYESFAADIDRLHERLSQRLAAVEGATMFVFHPAFGYFADTYGLEQKAIETGGKEPSSAQLEQIVEAAQDEGVRVIFVQPQFARSAAERIAEAIDGAVVAIDPLAEDWMENMETIAERVEEGVQ